MKQSRRGGHISGKISIVCKSGSVRSPLRTAANPNEAIRAKSPNLSSSGFLGVGTVTETCYIHPSVADKPCPPRKFFWRCGREVPWSHTRAPPITRRDIPGQMPSSDSIGSGKNPRRIPRAPGATATQTLCKRRCAQFHQHGFTNPWLNHNCLLRWQGVLHRTLQNVNNMFHKYKMLGLAAACTLLNISKSKAAVTLTFVQMGNDVKASWSGSYSLPSTGVAFAGSTGSYVGPSRALGRKLVFTAEFSTIEPFPHPRARLSPRLKLEPHSVFRVPF